MFRAGLRELAPAADGAALQTYVLGLVDFEDALALQRRLVYEVSGGEPAAVILCEHPTVLTVGRHGSRSHIHIEPRDLELHGWRIKWINRGGGCWLQAPGQLAIYPIIPLQERQLTVGGYLRRLQRALMRTLADFALEPQARPNSLDVWLGNRPVACLGVAVRHWVAYHGAILNIDPDLTPFRDVRTGKDHAPMTSLERERRGRVRPGMVRQLLLDHLALELGFERTVLFTEHSLLQRREPAHAPLAAR